MLITPIVNVEDSLVPFESLQKNGYYKVGDKVFQSKLCALQHASRYHESVSWHFNEDAFAGINWRQRLNTDIRHLYRMRAQQLRDKYDYLVLSWSGGGDSTTALRAFLDNNIRLDEIIIFWPQSLTKGKFVASWNLQSENFLSEWELSIQPQLNELRQKHPDIKVTLIEDISQESLSQPRDWGTVITKTEKHNFVTIARQQALDRFIDQRSQQHSNIATIFGVSGPRVAIYDDWLTCQFSDIDCGIMAITDITAGGYLRNVEFFYWTPDLPELMREQVHMILDHINAYPETRKLIPKLEMQPNGVLRHKRTAGDFVETWRQLRREILYPDYPRGLLQVHKPKESYNGLSFYDWFFRHSEAHSYLDPWRGALRSHLSVIDPKFTGNNNWSNAPYDKFVSRPYVVGRLKPLSDQL